MIPIDTEEFSVWLKGVRGYYARRGLLNIEVQFRQDAVFRNDIVCVRADGERTCTGMTRMIPLLVTGRSQDDIKETISTAIIGALDAFANSQGPPARNYTAREVTQRLMPNAPKFMLPPDKPAAPKFMLPPDKPAAPKKPSVFERKPLRRKIHPDVV